MIRNAKHSEYLRHYVIAQAAFRAAKKLTGINAETLRICSAGAIISETEAGTFTRQELARFYGGLMNYDRAVWATNRAKAAGFLEVSSTRRAKSLQFRLSVAGWSAVRKYASEMGRLLGSSASMSETGAVALW
jgi:hypothetical protein